MKLILPILPYNANALQRTSSFYLSRAPLFLVLNLIQALIQLLFSWRLQFGRKQLWRSSKSKLELFIPALLKLQTKLIKKIRRSIWLFTHKTDYFPSKFPLKLLLTKSLNLRNTNSWKDLDFLYLVSFYKFVFATAVFFITQLCSSIVFSMPRCEEKVLCLKKAGW